MGDSIVGHVSLRGVVSLGSRASGSNEREGMQLEAKNVKESLFFQTEENRPSPSSNIRLNENFDGELTKMFRYIELWTSLVFRQDE